MKKFGFALLAFILMSLASGCKKADDNNPKQSEITISLKEVGDNVAVINCVYNPDKSQMYLLSLNPIRSFVAAGYFGKGPDRFEISSNEPGSAVAEDRTYSVELDAEGKINVMHEEYGEGSHVDYTFTYSEIRK